MVRPVSGVSEVEHVDPAGVEERYGVKFEGMTNGAVADPRERKQKAWTLLARNGFDPEVSRAAALRFVAGTAEPEPLED